MNPKSLTRSMTALVVCLVVAPAVTVHAQENPDNVFSEVIEVNVVNVVVNVTDKEGSPVLGLTADDFEILEDGKPVTISNFYTVESGKPPSRFVQAETRPTWVPLDEVEPTTPEEEATWRHIAIFVDNNHISKRDRKRVFEGLRDFLSSGVDDQDRIMVTSFGQDFETVQGFTNSLGDVVMAVDRLEKAPAEGTHTENSHRQILRSLTSVDLAPPLASGPDGQVSTAVSRARVESASRTLLYQINQEAREGYERARRSIEALAYEMSSMAGLPGRKAIVYVSDGLPLRPAETLYHAHYNRFNSASEVLEFEMGLDPPAVAATQWDLTRQFEALLTHAQANQIMFSAIDAAGQRSTFSMGAEIDYRDPDSMATAEMGATWDTRLDMLHQENLQGSLRLLAGGTGGEVLINNRDYEDFFDRLNRNLRNYYSLGYQAPHPKQGQIHKLEVRLKDPSRRRDLKLRYQEAYHDKTWNMRLTDMVVAKLIHGVGANDLEVQLTTAQSEPKDKNKFVVPIQIGVPVGKLMLVEGADHRHSGRVSVVLVVKDPGGNLSPPQTIPLAVNLTRAQVLGAPTAVAEVKLLMERGSQTIGIGVRDELTGEMATGAFAVEVPSHGTQQTGP